MLERLRARACAWVVTEREEGAAPDFLLTAPWTYLRLRRPAYVREELAAWVARLCARDLSEAFVFFKHEDAGAGPRLAGEFLELMERATKLRAVRALSRRPRRRRIAGARGRLALRAGSARGAASGR